MTRLNKSVSRVTNESLVNCGPDAKRPFVATLEPHADGPVLILRPLGVRVPSARTVIKLADIYRHVLRWRENARNLEKANAAKQKKAEARAARAANRATRKLFEVES